MDEYVLTLDGITIPVEEEPKIGDHVVVVVFGNLGARIEERFVIVPSTAMFEMGDFFSYGTESEELNDDKS